VTSSLFDPAGVGGLEVARSDARRVEVEVGVEEEDGLESML
jgi:hypothetical protein